jgi:transcriptional regulator with XRE-family HTH domain
MSRTFADCKGNGNTFLCSLPKDRSRAVWQNARMENSKNGGPNYLRHWREYRRMTQEQLAGACDPPTTGSVISLLEEGERGLSLKWLRRLAPALKTRPGHLADVNPLEADTLTQELIDSIPADKREQAIAILRTFLDGTNG